MTFRKLLILPFICAMLLSATPAQSQPFFRPVGKDQQTSPSLANPLPIEVENTAPQASYTAITADTATLVAAGLVAAIKANPSLFASSGTAGVGISAVSNSSGTITVSYTCAPPSLQFSTTGSETCTITTSQSSTTGLWTQTLLVGGSIVAADINTITFTPVGKAHLYNTTGAITSTNCLGVIEGNATLSTYLASTGYLTMAASTTDLVGVVGSATKTVKIQKIVLNSTQTTAGLNKWYLIKRSAADTGGSPSAATLVPLDSGNSAATAVVNAYTANPSPLGATVGTIATETLVSPAPTGTTSGQFVLFDAKLTGQPIVLKGVAQELDINFNGVSPPTGISPSFDIQFTEE